MDMTELHKTQDYTCPVVSAEGFKRVYALQCLIYVMDILSNRKGYNSIAVKSILTAVSKASYSGMGTISVEINCRARGKSCVETFTITFQLMIE